MDDYCGSNLRPVWFDNLFSNGLFAVAKPVDHNYSGWNGFVALLFHSSCILMAGCFVVAVLHEPRAGSILAFSHLHIFLLFLSLLFLFHHILLFLLILFLISLSIYLPSGASI